MGLGILPRRLSVGSWQETVKERNGSRSPPLLATHHQPPMARGGDHRCGEMMNGKQAIPPPTYLATITLRLGGVRYCTRSRRKGTLRSWVPAHGFVRWRADRPSSSRSRLVLSEHIILRGSKGIP